MIVKPLIINAAMVLLASCSPYAYQPEIAGFSSGVSAVAASYDSGRQALSAAIVQQRQQDFAAARAKIGLQDGCDQVDPSGNPPTLPDCAIVYMGSAAIPAPPEAAYQPELAKAAPVFAALKQYADALAAVTAAADEAALNKASQGLVSSTAGLAGAVAKIKPQANVSGSVVSAGGTLAGQAIGVYLDSRRYDLLRSQVPAADKAVATLAQTVQAALQLIRAMQAQQLQKELHAAEAPFLSPKRSSMSETEYQAKFAALQGKVDAFNQLRSANPAAAAKALVNAHHTLALALQDNTAQAEPVAAAMMAFLASATQLQDALNVASTPAKTASLAAKPKPLK